jgi:hypothetical protein
MKTRTAAKAAKTLRRIERYNPKLGATIAKSLENFERERVDRVAEKIAFTKEDMEELSEIAIGTDLLKILIDERHGPLDLDSYISYLAKHVDDDIWKLSERVGDRFKERPPKEGGAR